MLKGKVGSLFAIATTFALVGCGEIESKPETVENVSTNSSTTGCVFDTDCVAGEVCEQEACVATCDIDADCVVGEICEPRQNGTGSVCLDDGSGQNNVANNMSEDECATRNDPNSFCEDVYGDDYFCDTVTGLCEESVMANETFLVQIQDVTTSDEGCFEVDDPGSDIQAIELQSSTGANRGWGNLVFDSVIETGNFETNYGVINGSPNPASDASGCVETFSGNVLSLGCGGTIVVEFIDESSTQVPIQSGDTIVIYEYGGVCSTGTFEDEYTAFICTDTAAASSGDLASCSEVLGTGSGITSITAP